MVRPTCYGSGAMPTNPKPRRRAPGAGRPAIYGRRQRRHNIYLPAAHAAAAIRYGQGVLSAGVRRLIEEHLLPPPEQ
jgi:hypothetical protein